jgi:hypothetical protein
MDFHKLEDSIQSLIADRVKILADEEKISSKIVILGINEAGRSLINFAPDLVNRIDIIRFENSPDDKVLELIGKGEKELNIEIDTKESIIKEANGGFYIAQMICSEICQRENLLETSASHRTLSTSFEGVKSAIWKRLSDTFYDLCKAFALGARYRPEGRAPYLHLLNWLTDSGEWVLNLSDALRAHPDMKLSVNQVIEKGYLEALFKNTPGIEKVLHYDGHSIVAEDPQFVFYIRNMPWARFARDLGFRKIGFRSRYDFALSFAGSQRDLAESIFDLLIDKEVSVFYDKNEQHRILSSNIEEYLEPIYQSEADFVICIIDKDYPTRIWTAFEAGTFKDRVKRGEVIPIVVDGTPIDAFSSLAKIGHLSVSRSDNLQATLLDVTTMIAKKLTDADPSHADC